MRPRNRKKSIFSSVRQKKYKRYNVPVGPLFNNYDQTLKKTRLTSRCAQVDRFLAIHLQYLQVTEILIIFFIKSLNLRIYFDVRKFVQVSPFRWGSIEETFRIQSTALIH